MGLEIIKINAKITGISDIMFDKFIDHSKGKRPPEQKLYLAEGNKVVFPQDNLVSFLFGETPAGCAKAFEGKKCKEYIRMGMSHVFIEEPLIPFFDGNDEEIVFDGFKDNFWIHKGAPRTKSGSLSIKQEVKERPVLKMPWSLLFTITVVKNVIISETKLFNWFMVGGMQIAIGTYRPRWGRFEVKEWKVDAK
jgi:hypothetical protein